MIVKFFKSGISNGSGPINYLLGKNDSNGDKRKSEPEIMYGDPTETRLIIDSIANKWKYTSGVIAFREKEKPTDLQISKIIHDFQRTFAPGLENRVNFLFIKHEDKNNLELHFVVPRIELETRKAFNIMPPGVHSQKLARDFAAWWNSELGYEQVQEKKVNVRKSKYLWQTNADTKRSKAIDLIADKFIIPGIESGIIKNRDELAEAFKKAGLQITRQGKDYISVKTPKMDKAIRLKGAIFEEGADYQKLLKEDKQSSKPKTTLSQVEREVLIKSIARSVKQRKTFNTERFTRKIKTYVMAIYNEDGKRDPTKVKVLTPKGIEIRAVQPKGTTSPAQQQRDAVAAKIDQVKPRQHPKQHPHETRNNTGVSSTPAPMTPSNITSLVASIANLDADMRGIAGQINQAKTPIQKAALEQKMQQLLAQKRKLEIQLLEAREQFAELSMKSHLKLK